MKQPRDTAEQAMRVLRALSWTQPQRSEAPLEEHALNNIGQTKEWNNTSTTDIEDSQEDIDGVYVISVAARILRMHPQTLRKYERAGLVRPSRTIGMLRLYSEEDIARLRLIKHLVDDLRLNLAGVDLALNLMQSFSAIHRQSLLNQEAQKLRNFISRELDDLFRILEM